MQRQGVRSSWDDVPSPVRTSVEELLGATITATRALSGGFSPGPAVRAELGDRRVVFLKAAGSQPNAVSPEMHRREAQVLELLPPGVPAPRLLGVVDDGDWVVLCTEWVEGATPTATEPHDVDRLLRLLERCSRTSLAATAGIAPLQTVHADLFGQWQLLARDVPSELDDWSRRHLDRLVELDDLAPTATEGARLLHVDVRTDNVLFDHDDAGRDVLVDWPGACVGAGWVDLVALLPALHLDGGPPPAEVLDHSATGRAAEPEAVDTFVVALAGYFTRMSLLPAPPGLPTLRPFQAAQGSIARDWAAERLRLR